ncbi:intermembrane transport protein PqiB [Aquitalea sp. S1-19]|nr:intermembrane transport protein PqiB [Aquitalea sp. S1-19]
MTEPADNKQPIARVAKLRQLSLVWIVPIVALIAGLWMVYTTWSNQGPQITLHLPSAEGIEVGKTQIKILDVNIGKVSEVSLAPDHTAVIIKAQLDKSAAPLLFQDSQFWVVRPRVENGGVSGLSTLLSGVYIKFQPGKSGELSREFKVLATPPITAPDVPGLRLQLNARDVKTLNVGDPVLFQHFEVGRIEKAEFDTAAREMRYQLFIKRPYDQLVTANSRFWLTSGVGFNLSANGISVNVGSLATLLGGGISFDVPSGHELGDRVANQSKFTLYASEESASNLYYEQQLPFVALFDESVRGLQIGAPVEYRGIRIGTVAAVPLFTPALATNATGKRAIPVLLKIEVGRFDDETGERPQAFWQKRIDQAIQNGMVAKLKTGNLLSGALFIDIDFSGKRINTLPKPYRGYPILPTSNSGGLSQIENKVIALLDKLNALKLEQTLDSANGALNETRSAASEAGKLAQSLNSLVASPDAQALPAELRQTLAKLGTTLDGFSKGSVAYSELSQTLSTLGALLQETRPVVRTLNESPNALLFDRSTPDPTPKGARP